MRTINLLAIAGVITGVASADVHRFRGSDTMRGLVSSAIEKIQAGVRIQYDGGGSGEAEKGLTQRRQGIAPLSREVKPEVVRALSEQGVSLADHVVALDGVVVYVNERNSVAFLTLQDLRDIFECRKTDWKDFSGSGIQGSIRVYRRDDASGTTDTFKSLVGIKEFGSCAHVVADTEDIKHHTDSEEASLGYAGLSGKSDKNRALSLARVLGDFAVKASVDSIRNGRYPLARKLHVYEATGALTPNLAERELLSMLTNLREMKAIVTAHDFVPLVD